jgi:type I restriction enzyme S subunit
MSWHSCQLGDVITLKRGHDLPERKREPGDVPVVSSSGITGRHNVPKATSPGVVTGRYGTLGEVYYLEEHYWPLNTALYVIDFKGNNPRFSAYFLKHVLRNYKSDKSAVPGVDRNVLHALKVQVPDRRTQERIVDVLSVYDDLIENNYRRIELLEQAARELHKEWFVRFRFPGHEHWQIVNEAPEGWGLSAIGDVCLDFVDGDWIETKDQGGDDFRILQISNIGLNEFVETGNLRYISEQTFNRLHCHEVSPGDILISRMPKHIGRAWLVTEKPWRMVTVVDVTIARCDPEQANKFFFVYHLNSSVHIARCEAKATGATRQRIARKTMASLPILLAPRVLQEQFADFAKSIHSQKAILIQEVDRLAEVRDLLLPKLMTGEIAV